MLLLLVCGAPAALCMPQLWARFCLVPRLLQAQRCQRRSPPWVGSTASSPDGEGGREVLLVHRGATRALLAAGAGHGAPRGGIPARWSCASPAHPAGRGGGSGTSLEPQPRLAPALLLLHSCRRSWGCVARAALPRWVPRCRWPGAGLGASSGVYPGVKVIWFGQGEGNVEFGSRECGLF